MNDEELKVFIGWAIAVALSVIIVTVAVMELRPKPVPPEPTRVEIGMWYKQVTEMCGKPDQVSLLETSFGIDIYADYTRHPRTHPKGCYGQMRFHDERLRSVYRP